MMHIVRPIKQEEYAAAKAVWDRCFPEDAGDYSAFYFTCRTRPEYILAAFSPEGKMIGTLHALPYPLRFGETVKRCALVTGVATLPEYRMRGVAAAMLRRSETWLREKGIADEIIALVLEEFSPEEEETVEKIRELIERKYPMAQEDEKVRRRAVAALQRYGYSLDDIFTVLREELFD